jgi:hypothetical protein
MGRNCHTVKMNTVIRLDYFDCFLNADELDILHDFPVINRTFLNKGRKDIKMLLFFN